MPPRCAAKCVHTISILHNALPCTVHIDTLTGTITLAMRQCEDKDGSMWDQRRTKMKRRAYPHNPDKPRESDLQPTSNHPASCTPQADQSATQHKHTTVHLENSTQHNLKLSQLSAILMCPPLPVRTLNPCRALCTPQHPPSRPTLAAHSCVLLG